MNYIKAAASTLAAFATFATPISALAGTTDQAESIRKLDIMLMVTALRCRTGTDNFQPDYARFSATHLQALNSASRTLQANLVKKAGTKGAKKALDKISVGMANQYGQGHPWLGCGELKQITKALAADKDSTKLATAAGELLSTAPRGQWAMAGGR